MEGSEREGEAVDHPLAMDAEAMRRAGYATVDALVARLADPEADPVLRRAGAAAMRARLGGPPPEQPGDYGAVLARVLADVLPYAARTDHPGYLAFIPSFTTWPAALAELTAAAANVYCGAWMDSAGATQFGPTAPQAVSPSPCAPARDRPTPALSIRSPTSPTSVPPNASGCTSTRRTGALPR